MKESYAHEWMQKLPLTESTLICVRCNHEVKISELSKNGVKCILHYVGKDSGWKS